MTQAMRMVAPTLRLVARDTGKTTPQSLEMDPN